MDQDEKKNKIKTVYLQNQTFLIYFHLNYA